MCIVAMWGLTQRGPECFLVTSGLPDAQGQVGGVQCPSEVGSVVIQFYKEQK